jgi:branched-chain amino acid transport system ATP-binding protein
MTALLEFDRVSASYDGAPVLREVSFAVQAGETVGLVGRNGAGKSTTLGSVFRLPQVTGTIRVNGSPLGRRRYEAAKRGIGLVPQGKGILKHLTVQENILLGRSSGRPETWTLAELYELFPNLGRATRRPGTALSGGEQQMLAIARALIGSPLLLMLDEPTEGLAPVVVDQLRDTLRLIQERGTAVLLVEQHIALVQDLASRFVALQTGVVAAEGPVEELSTRAVQEIIAL